MKNPVFGYRKMIMETLFNLLSSLAAVLQWFLAAIMAKLK
jgi:hypothetical protein